MPLRSRMSGRAVATASFDVLRSREVAFRRHREHDEPRGDRQIDRGKGQNGEADAGARLGGAVDVAAVEQRAQQPAALGLRRHDDRRQIVRGRKLLDHRQMRSDRVHRCPSRLEHAAGQRIESRCCRSVCAIASIGGGCTTCGGRSGSLSSASYWVASAGRRCRWRRARPWMRAGFSKRRPFGAQRRDGVALALHVAAHLGDALGAQGQLELDLVDIGRGERPAGPGRRG